MSKHSRYPGYDVWEEHPHWDDHTKKIVGSRRTPQVSYSFFSQGEALLMQTVVSVLVNDHRLEVLTYVTQHLDESLASPIGEAQRKVGVLPKKQLYRKGLAGVDAESHARYGVDYVVLKKEEQQAVLQALAEGETKAADAWSEVDSVTFFKRVLREAVDAYYSHPLVWSDIGYGGPAYPRGYVRVEKGLTDPWEAKASET
ncbi:gluconate 2-dehydrogenase subunit 3 family protein [Brevibacillus panacihumi]|uniref:Gluconate 2-dehydrogenase subunit 3 family protein n=1 Tax=Brevibacillus panacihumi TaxID=497735 RepID=A0A3M8D6I4_9BACL|nr:gluconate 2-dehydrogenase subunit 3 family protein [Brevibacillus panacihumi]RNB83528.1 gluconate 2-dehydrogenase subunit 3 family protein [Brevibacillus panacihumi]